jgi:PAS domain S-box-containing protein
MIKNRYVTVIFVYFLFLLLTSIFTASAQPKRLQFKHLTLDDGLSSSSVISVLKDHKGFMWFGTYNGLNRYDGLNFVVYKHNPADSASLPDDLVRTIFEDHNKNLFIGTNGGLCLYNRKMDKFLNYMIDQSSPLRGIKCMVLRIAEDSLGNLWLGTDAGLIYFDHRNNKIVQYTHDPNNPNYLNDDNVEGVLIDKYSRLWVTTQKGLNLFLPETKTFKHITRVNNGAFDLSNTYFMDLTEDREGIIWLGSRNGLYCFQNNPEAKIINLINYQYNAQDKYSLTNNRAKSLYVDDKGDLWVGTENWGLNLFDRKNKRFWHYRKDDYDPNSLNNESIQAIYQDKEGNLWVCTFTGGINVALKNKDAILSYQSLPGAPLSLSNNTVSCFLEDHFGRIWAGTDGGGLNLFSEETNTFLRFNTDNSKMSSNAILCMIEDSKNRIWLGTWAGGLMCFDSKTKSFTSLTTANSGIQDNNIYGIAEGDNDDLWLASFSSGLIHYQIKERKFTNYTTSNSDLYNKMIVKIKKDSQGHLFLGFTNGLQIFSPDKKSFITYTHNPNNTNSLSHESVFDILIENDTCVWIGTQNGLNRFNPMTGYFKKYFKEDGLPDNVIKGLVLDKSGMLWVTTNNGVSQFDYKQEKFKNFTKSDGLQSNEFYNRSVLRKNNGALFMGGTKGFNIVYPEKIVENKNIPGIVITDFKIFNTSVKPGAENSPLIQTITETKNLTVSYSQSVLTFSFVAMDFLAPEKNQYAYQMVGFDKDWIYTGNKREATYTNLNPGEYTFRVKGSNNDGLWNEEGISIRITITPPWWQTLWFRVILFVVLISVLYWIYMWRVQLRDLAAKRRMEAAVTKERNLLRTLIDNLPDAVYVEDLDCKKIIVNPVELRYLGAQSEAEVIGKTDYDFYPADTASVYITAATAIMKSGVPHIDPEGFFIDKQGNKLNVVHYSIPLHDEHGTVSGLVGVTHDITALKRVQEALQNERKILRTLIDNIPDAIYIKDDKCRKIIANLADVHNMGLQSEAEVLGKDDFELFPKEIADKFIADDQSVIQTGKPVIEREEYVIDGEGQKHFLLTTKLPFRDEQNQIIGLIGIGRDITKRKIVEEERERLIKELQNAVADIKVLSGLVPICSSCKKIRDDKGYWNQLEGYIQAHSQAKFSHGVCPDCMKKLYPNFVPKKTE